MNKQTEALKIKYTEQQLRIIALQEAVKIHMDSTRNDRSNVVAHAEMYFNFLKGKK